MDIAKAGFLLAAALLCFGPGHASADPFGDRCAELRQQTQISVTFEDRAPDLDRSRSLGALGAMSGKRAEGHHVYGLTRAQPYFRVAVAARAIGDDQGRVCAIPDISVRLGLSELTVYLASELTDPCRRGVIRDHEEEHVNTWKAHLRASAQLLTTALNRDVGEPRIYVSREQAEAGVRAWSNELLAPWPKRIADIVTEAHRAIDTPTSYASVAARLRACPAGRR